MSWDPSRVFRSLSRRRPIFHSEADFQHELGREVASLYPRLQVRLEVPRRLREQGKSYRAHVDLRIVDRTRTTWVELKYKTIRRDVLFANERFELQNHSAVDGARSDFWVDVERLEQLCKLEPELATQGLAVFLTNNPTFWTNSGGGDASDEEFRLVNDRTVRGTLTYPVWKEHGRKKGPWRLKLTGKYRGRWRDYSQLGDHPYESLRYFAIVVDGHLTRSDSR